MAKPDDHLFDPIAWEVTRTEAFRRAWARILADKYRPRYAVLAEQMATHALNTAAARRFEAESGPTHSLGIVMQIKLPRAREKWANYQN